MCSLLLLQRTGEERRMQADGREGRKYSMVSVTEAAIQLPAFPGWWAAFLLPDRDLEQSRVVGRP